MPRKTARGSTLLTMSGNGACPLTGNASAHHPIPPRPPSVFTAFSQPATVSPHFLHGAAGTLGTWRCDMLDTIFMWLPPVLGFEIAMFVLIFIIARAILSEEKAQEEREAVASLHSGRQAA